MLYERMGRGGVPGDSVRSTVCAVSAVAVGVGLAVRARVGASGGFDRGSAQSSHTGASAASFKKVQWAHAHDAITARLVARGMATSRDRAVKPRIRRVSCASGAAQQCEQRVFAQNVKNPSKTGSTVRGRVL
jgi:hypothetical protein